jgi:hypothetical protein
MSKIARDQASGIWFDVKWSSRGNARSKTAFNSFLQVSSDAIRFDALGVDGGTIQLCSSRIKPYWILRTDFVRVSALPPKPVLTPIVQLVQINEEYMIHVSKSYHRLLGALSPSHPDHLHFSYHVLVFSHRLQLSFHTCMIRGVFQNMARVQTYLATAVTSTTVKLLPSIRSSSFNSRHVWVKCCHSFLKMAV